MLGHCKSPKDDAPGCLTATVCLAATGRQMVEVLLLTNAAMAAVKAVSGRHAADQGRHCSRHKPACESAHLNIQQRKPAC